MKGRVDLAQHEDYKFGAEKKYKSHNSSTSAKSPKKNVGILDLTQRWKNVEALLKGKSITVSRKKLKTCSLASFVCLLAKFEIECVFTSVLSPPEWMECRNPVDRFDSEQRTRSAVEGSPIGRGGARHRPV
ncbi:hypothetical protein TNCV_1288141 [Trichonephila clavipes]|nr:hypothetical protein TNCV_1288141 [Trichonephila clavipes]